MYADENGVFLALGNFHTARKVVALLMIAPLGAEHSVIAARHYDIDVSKAEKLAEP